MLYVGHGMWVLMSYMVHAIVFIKLYKVVISGYIASYVHTGGWIGIKF